MCLLISEITYIFFFILGFKSTFLLSCFHLDFFLFFIFSPHFPFNLQNYVWINKYHRFGCTELQDKLWKQCFLVYFTFCGLGFDVNSTSSVNSSPSSSSSVQTVSSSPFTFANRGSPSSTSQSPGFCCNEITRIKI